MSKQFVCDLTGTVCNDTDLGEYTISEANVQVGGKSVNVQLVVKLDVQGSSPTTNIAPSTWPTVMNWVKNKLNQVFP
jgi:hypothetical protein